MARLQDASTSKLDTVDEKSTPSDEKSTPKDQASTPTRKRDVAPAGPIAKDAPARAIPVMGKAVAVAAVTPTDKTAPAATAPAADPTFDAALAAVQKKAKMGGRKQAVLAILAGIFIALGASVLLIVKSDTSLSFGVSQVLGGVGFSVGLFMVFNAGAELFTGNCLLVMGALEKRFTFKDVLSNWVRVYAGNLVGSLIMVALLMGATFYLMGDSAVGAAAIKVAASKANQPLMTIFFRGILCNMLVCLAVWMQYGRTDALSRFLAALMPVAAFVACGFEHCVANLFLLPLGLATQAVMGGAALTVGACLGNIVMATLGNLIGGVAIGVAYWLVWTHRQER